MAQALRIDQHLVFLSVPPLGINFCNTWNGTQHWPHDPVLNGSSLCEVVDTYRGDFVPTTMEKFAVYLAFFPHLVAGPIVRPGELIPQLDKPRNPRRVDTSRAFYLIATGLFKKVVIANYLAANIVDEVFGAPGQHSSLEILVGVYAYAVQIYADFSGYTDIAIGIALLLAVIVAEASPPARIIRRSTLLRSWRTLPGQSWDCSTASASSPMLRFDNPVACEI